MPETMPGWTGAFVDEEVGIPDVIPTLNDELTNGGYIYWR